MTFKHSTTKHLSIFVALLLLAGTMASCNGAGNAAETDTETESLTQIETQTDTNTEIESDTETETETETETQSPTVVYVPISEDVTFVSDEEKAAWRELLVNCITQLQEEGSYWRSCRLSLADINCDGVPELLFNAGGGSMMNSDIMVHDLKTGDRLGWFEIGLTPIKVYYHTPTGTYKHVTTFAWRAGGDNRSYHTGEIVHDATEGVAFNELFSAEYFLEKKIEFDASQAKSANDEEWQAYGYRVNGEKATLGQYMSAMHDFADDYVLIPDAQVQEVRWTDLDGFQMERSVSTDAQWAEKMADALLSTPQKFIKFE